MSRIRPENYLSEVAERVDTLATVPQQRKAFKQGYSFSGEEYESSTWDHIWNHSTCDRSRTQAIYFAETLISKKDFTSYRTLITKWQDNVNNWWHCDGLAKIYSKLLEKSEKEFLTTLHKWNTDKDPWKRRQSIVSLLYYSRTKKKVLQHNLILGMIGNLLEAPEYYVQKGVGWSLREVHNVYPAETKAFMRREYKRISGIAFTAATEKFDSPEKEYLKNIRAKFRSA